jgi:hypothetical protein
MSPSKREGRCAPLQSSFTCHALAERWSGFEVWAAHIAVQKIEARSDEEKRMLAAPRLSYPGLPLPCRTFFSLTPQK